MSGFFPCTNMVKMWAIYNTKKANVWLWHLTQESEYNAKCWHLMTQSTSFKLLLFLFLNLVLQYKYFLIDTHSKSQLY